MSDFTNRSQNSARRGDYVWQYEYYDDEEPVSFEGLKAHRCELKTIFGGFLPPVTLCRTRVPSIACTCAFVSVLGKQGYLTSTTVWHYLGLELSALQSFHLTPTYCHHTMWRPDFMLTEIVKNKPPNEKIMTISKKTGKCWLYLLGEGSLGDSNQRYKDEFNVTNHKLW